MQRLLSDSTRAVLAERQRVARVSTPSSVNGSGALVRRSAGSVGNWGLANNQAGWSITKGDTPSTMQRDGTQARLIGFEKHPVVMACVRLITNIVAAVPMEVYRKLQEKETVQKGGAGDVILLPEHPAQAVFDRPYFSMSPHRFRQLIGVHYSLYGNWFAAIIREGATSDRQGQSSGGGLPFMLRLVHPERLMYVYLDAETEEPILYDWRDRYGVRHRTPALDMLHCADMTATDWIFGYPRAAAALLDISTDNEASNYVRQVVHNDGTAGTIIMLDALLGEHEAQKLKDRYYERNIGRGDRGKTSFMGGVKDVKQIGFTLKDLEFPNLRQVAREDICACFGVDPRAVGVGSAVGAGDRGGLSGKQFLEARFRLIQETVLPQMRDWEAFFNTWFMPEFGPNAYCRFSRKSLSELTEDETETWTRVTAAVVGGLLSREEGRSYVGQPDKMDDTDTLYVPSLTKIMPVAEQFAAVDQQSEMHDARVGAIKTGAQAAAAGANTGDKGKGGGDPKDKKPAGGPGGKPTPKSVITSEPGSTSGAEVLQPLQQRRTALAPEVRTAAWQALQSKAERHEPKMQQAAHIRFRIERDKVDKIIRHHSHGRALRATIPDPHVNAALKEIKDLYRVPGGLFVLDWESDFADLISEAVDTGGMGVSAALSVNWDLSNPQVALAIKRRAKNLAANVGPTTQEQITAAMSLAFDSSMTMKEMADLVSSTAFGDDMTAMRARMIARTEAIGALNEGEYRSANLSGVVETKEWLTQGDALVRDSHAELDGVEIPIDETFDNGCAYPGDEDGDPEEVINCRCGLLYHTTSDDGEDDTTDGDPGEGT